MHCICMNENEIRGGKYYSKCKDATNKLRKDIQPKRYSYVEDSMEWKLYETTKKCIAEKGFKYFNNVDNNKDIEI